MSSIVYLYGMSSFVLTFLAMTGFAKTQHVARMRKSRNRLFHLISIYPLWMIFNERPGGWFEPCPGGSKTGFNEGKVGFGANLIVSRG